VANGVGGGIGSGELRGERLRGGLYLRGSSGFFYEICGGSAVRTPLDSGASPLLGYQARFMQGWAVKMRGRKAEGRRKKNETLTVFFEAPLKLAPKKASRGIECSMLT